MTTHINGCNVMWLNYVITFLFAWVTIWRKNFSVERASSENIWDRIFQDLDTLTRQLSERHLLSESIPQILRSTFFSRYLRQRQKRQNPTILRLEIKTPEEHINLCDIVWQVGSKNISVFKNRERGNPILIDCWSTAPHTHTHRIHKDPKPRTMHRGLNGTGRRNTEPSINTFFTDKNIGKDERLSHIDNEIMRVEDNIVTLVMQRAYLKRRRNALSPAVNLPPELLALIFEHACLPNGGDDEDQIYPHEEILPGGTNLGLSVGPGAVTPIFLGTICSTWRHISQNTSQIWDTVYICVNNQHAESQAVLLRSWLKRSNQRPLTIKLLEDVDENENDNDNDNDNDWGIDVTSTSVIDALTAHSKQWHTVDIFLPSTWKPALSGIKHKLPLLTNATLRVAEGCPTLSRVDMFALAPQLREVRLVGYSIADVLLPWAQLHRLDGEFFCPGDCLDTLYLGPNLRICQFEQLYRGIHPFVVRPIRHEHLESLELIMDTTHEVEALFGALTLPNLTELVLSLSDAEEPILRPLMPLMDRSSFRLNRLHLVGVTPEEDVLIRFLKEQPTLKTLLLINPATESGGKLTQRFIDAMMPMSSIGGTSSGDQEINHSEFSCLTPTLEHLEYQGAISFASEGLTQLLAARWQLGCIDNVKDDNVPRRLHPVTSRISVPEDTDKTPHPHTCPQRRAQLRSVIITTTKKIKFSCSDIKIVERLVDEGMHLDFLADVNSSFNSNFSP